MAMKKASEASRFVRGFAVGSSATNPSEEFLVALYQGPVKQRSSIWDVGLEAHNNLRCLAGDEKKNRSTSISPIAMNAPTSGC
jgi:hypothetical protein